LTSVDELIAYFANAEKKTLSRRVGLEHEKFIYAQNTWRPVPYSGGIERIFEALIHRGWAPYREAPHLPVIALSRNGATISLEPGGQLELSGAPYFTARECHDENLRHLTELQEVLAPLQFEAVAMGYRPFGAIDEMPWMPKRRYQAMRDSLGKRGELALDMMLMTATGQVSLDWTDEANCVRMMTLAVRLAPLLIAAYANSPFVRGQESIYRSYRSYVWRHVDAARCGFPPGVFDGSFSYRAYVDWALDAPLLFLRRRGQYLTPSLTFRQLLRDGFEGRPASVSDWGDHLSTLFPEVRLKRVIEFRSADSCDAGMTGALAALLRGLFYDASAFDELGQLLRPRSEEQQWSLVNLAQREGLKAFVPEAKDLLAIARRGLVRLGGDDDRLLDALDERVLEGQSRADEVLRFKSRPEDILRASALHQSAR
jgi:glutamate--cysteine ligase